MTDSSNLCEIMARVKPHEIYNLAAQSHVKVRSAGQAIPPHVAQHATYAKTFQFLVETDKVYPNAEHCGQPTRRPT
jgi:GDP-D-mannose dehydratase